MGIFGKIAVLKDAGPLVKITCFLFKWRCNRICDCIAQGSSSIGRAAVSKTVGCGIDASLFFKWHSNREKVMNK
jgi:hypothetical protein